MTPRAPLNPSFEATRAAEVNAFGQQIARREEKMREAEAAMKAAAARLEAEKKLIEDLRKQYEAARKEARVEGNGKTARAACMDPQGCVVM